ncbi:class II aldolase/adducin family protein [Streptomyces prasinopilosus]|uniref:L-fuculose-phosphate aldolase n=1 Tax=Streptomyces prasinopilosus TaxID=67344 RepID=A0A1G6LDF3_9ACTN|nr:class II aldolase/adducin family protein [Streptomyces prasinopilosus]SDC41452.1 L-fuculose-phosphate aldolase [Streptomyces prasinopilosus]
MKPVRIRDDVESQRRHLSALGRSLGRRARPAGTSGSVSVRSGEAVLITAGDPDGRLTDRQETVMVDPFRGLPLIGESEWPPDETAVHLALYRRLPDCGAVIYAQGPCVEALIPSADGGGRSGRAVPGEPDTARTPGLPDARLPAEPLVTDRPDASRVAEDVAAALDASVAGPPPVLLVGRNGLVAWGRDTGEALAGLERVERLGHLLRAGADAGEPAAAGVNAR